MKTLGELRRKYYWLARDYPRSYYNRDYLLLTTSDTIEEAIEREKTALSGVRKQFRNYYRETEIRDAQLISDERRIVEFLNLATETHNYHTELSAEQLTLGGIFDYE